MSSSPMEQAGRADYRHSLDWADIVEGQALPPIHYEISLLRMVAFIRATGLFDYIHFDRDYARAVGVRDPFMGTPHIVGLMGRMLTDWSGPAGIIRSLSLDIISACCQDDRLVVTGRVGRKYRDADGAHLVELTDLVIGHDHAPVAVRGRAVMALPCAQDAALPTFATGVDILPSVAGDDVPPDIKPLIGRKRAGPHSGNTPLTAQEIEQWCECLEDWNPLYWDSEFAASSPHGGILAPPGMSWFFGAGSGVSAGIGWCKPGVTPPEPIRRGLTGLPLLQALRVGMMEANSPFTLAAYPEAVVRTVEDRYFTPMRPGDTLTDMFELADCSPLKRTKLGEGHFISFHHDFHNQRQELVRRITLSLFHFHP